MIDAKNQRRESLFEALHVLVLGSFAFAQPLYDLMSQSSAFFIIRRSRPVDVLAFMVVVSVLIPGTLALVAWLAGLLGRLPRLCVQRLLLFGLLGITALAPLKRWQEIPDARLLGLAGSIALVVTLAYHFSRTARSFFTLLVPAAIVFPLLFLSGGSIRKIIFPRQVETSAKIAPTSDVPVFVLLFDALPTTSLMNAERRIDARRYPGLGALASRSTWYRNHSAASDFTTYAVPPVLAGRFSDRSLLPSVVDYPNNLFTLLGDVYELRVFEPITRLCPEALCPGESQPLAERWRSLAWDLRVVYRHLVWPAGMNKGLPHIAQRWKDFTPERAARLGGPQQWKQKLFEQFMASIEPGTERTLTFVHLLWPHAPYELYPSGTFYTLNPGKPEGIWGDDAVVTEKAFQRHLLQVGLVDNLVGQLVARLEELDLFERSLIVLTADHGVSFRPNAYRRQVTADNFGDILPVPLLIKAPGQTKAMIDDRNSLAVDVLPTVAEHLGIELPFEVEGQSLLGSPRPMAEGKRFASREEHTFDGDLTTASDPTLERKLSLFALEAPGAMVHPRRRFELIDQRVEELPVAPSLGLQGGADAGPVLAGVDPASGSVPGLLSGWVEGELTGPVEVAVAVGGVIRAVAEAVPSALRADLRTWTAVVAEESFQVGDNPVEVLRVVPSADGSARLEALLASADREPFVDVRLGVEKTQGVSQQGFYRAEVDGDVRFRWTRGLANVRIPLTGRRQPAQVKVELLGSGPLPTELTIAVDQVVVFQGPVPEGPWSGTFDVSGIALGDMAIVRLAATPWVPSQVLEGSSDGRELGVKVTGIWLLGEPPPE